MDDLDIGIRLRAVREMHGLSQRALAKKANVANATISLIESGQSNPSVGALKRILDGIPMDLASFFSSERPKQKTVFYRVEDHVEIGKSGISFKAIATMNKSKKIGMIHEVYQPGTDTGRILLSHDGEECGVIIRGQLEVTVADQTRILSAGEAYYFDSQTPHRFRNTGSIECELVSACTPPSF